MDELSNPSTRAIQHPAPVPADGDVPVPQRKSARWSRPLEELAHVLSPTTAVPVIRRASPASAGALRLVALPHAGNPRLLLPADHSRAAASAVRRYGEGASVGQTWAVQAAALAVSTGVLGRQPLARLALTIGDAQAADVPLLTHLSEIVGEPVTVAVRTRPHRPNGKPVLLLLAPDGRMLGYTKIGGNLLTRGLVRNEARALTEFSENERERLSFDVPGVLHHGSWHDLELLVVTAVKSGRLSRRDPARRAMREIADRSGLNSMPLAESPFWIRTQERLAALPADDALVAAVTAATRAVTDRLGEERLLFGGCHGDWTPFNMSAADGRLSVWDWERSSSSAPVGLDLAHHLVMVANHRRRLDGHTVRRLGKRAEPVIADLGQASRQGPLLILLELLEMAVRFEEARAAGIAITNRYTSLLATALTFIDGDRRSGGRNASAVARYAF